MRRRREAPGCLTCFRVPKGPAAPEFLDLSRKKVGCFGLLAAGLFSIRRPGFAAHLVLLRQPRSTTRLLLVRRPGFAAHLLLICLTSSAVGLLLPIRRPGFAARLLAKPQTSSAAALLLLRLQTSSAVAFLLLGRRTDCATGRVAVS